MAPYILMFVLTIIIFCMALFFRHPAASKIGAISWLALSIYFVVEYVVIRATTAPYYLFRQPMSDLGVTSCGVNTYVLANYELCSPYHLLMNWTFTFTGISIFVGAIFLQHFWPSERKTRIATILLVIFGLSYAVSGIVPADVNFLVHTLGSLPGMIVQVPALLLIGYSIRRKNRKLSMWTYVCGFITTAALLMIFLQPIFPELPGGLIQRILYGSVYLWMSVTAIVILKTQQPGKQGQTQEILPRW